MTNFSVYGTIKKRDTGLARHNATSQPVILFKGSRVLMSKAILNETAHRSGIPTYALFKFLIIMEVG